MLADAEPAASDADLASEVQSFVDKPTYADKVARGAIVTRHSTGCGRKRLDTHPNT